MAKKPLSGRRSDPDRVDAQARLRREARGFQGGIAPASFSPSVSNINTVWPGQRLAGLLSSRRPLSARRRLMASPIASPMAVSVPATPTTASFRKRCTVARSEVSGACRYGLRAKQNQSDTVTAAAVDEAAGDVLYDPQAGRASCHVLGRHRAGHIDSQHQAAPGGGHRHRLAQPLRPHGRAHQQDPDARAKTRRP